MKIDRRGLLAGLTLGFSLKLPAMPTRQPTFRLPAYSPETPSVNAGGVLTENILLLFLKMAFTASPLVARISVSSKVCAAIHCYAKRSLCLHPTDETRLITPFGDLTLERDMRLDDWVGAIAYGDIDKADAVLTNVRDYQS